MLQEELKEKTTHFEQLKIKMKEKERGGGVPDVERSPRMDPWR